MPYAAAAALASVAVSGGAQIGGAILSSKAAEKSQIAAINAQREANELARTLTPEQLAYYRQILEQGDQKTRIIQQNAGTQSNYLRNIEPLLNSQTTLYAAEMQRLFPELPVRQASMSAGGGIPSLQQIQQVQQRTAARPQAPAAGQPFTGQAPASMAARASVTGPTRASIEDAARNELRTNIGNYLDNAGPQGQNLSRQLSNSAPLEEISRTIKGLTATHQDAGNLGRFSTWQNITDSGISSAYTSDLANRESLARDTAPQASFRTGAEGLTNIGLVNLPNPRTGVRPLDTQPAPIAPPPVPQATPSPLALTSPEEPRPTMPRITREWRESSEDYWERRDEATDDFEDDLADWEENRRSVAAAAPPPPPVAPSPIALAPPPPPVAPPPIALAPPPPPVAPSPLELAPPPPQMAQPAPAPAYQPAPAPAPAYQPAPPPIALAPPPPPVAPSPLELAPPPPQMAQPAPAPAYQPAPAPAPAYQPAPTPIALAPPPPQVAPTPHQVAPPPPQVAAPAPQMAPPPPAFVPPPPPPPPQMAGPTRASIEDASRNELRANIGNYLDNAGPQGQNLSRQLSNSAPLEEISRTIKGLTATHQDPGNLGRFRTWQNITDSGISSAYTSDLSNRASLVGGRVSPTDFGLPAPSGFQPIGPIAPPTAPPPAPAPVAVAAPPPAPIAPTPTFQPAPSPLALAAPAPQMAPAPAFVPPPPPPPVPQAAPPQAPPPAPVAVAAPPPAPIAPTPTLSPLALAAGARPSLPTQEGIRTLPEAAAATEQIVDQYITPTPPPSASTYEASSAQTLNNAAVFLKEGLQQLRGGFQLTAQQSQQIENAIDAARARANTSAERVLSENFRVLFREVAPSLGLRPGDTPNLDRAGLIIAEHQRQIGNINAELAGQEAGLKLNYPVTSGQAAATARAQLGLGLTTAGREQGTGAQRFTTARQNLITSIGEAGRGLIREGANIGGIAGSGIPSFGVNTPEVPTYTADTSLGRALTGAGQGLGTAIREINWDEINNPFTRQNQVPADSSTLYQPYDFQSSGQPKTDGTQYNFLNW
jgi:hypothetical protein